MTSVKLYSKTYYTLGTLLLAKLIKIYTSEKHNYQIQRSDSVGYSLWMFFRCSIASAGRETSKK